MEPAALPSSPSLADIHNTKPIYDASSSVPLTDPEALERVLGFLVVGGSPF